MSLLYIPKQTNMLFVHSAACLQDKCAILLFIITTIWLSLLLSDFISLLFTPLSKSQSCCFGCFDINVTMTPPFLIRKTMPSCNGFWEQEPATAASDMPDFPLSASVWIFLHSALFLPNFSLHLDLLFFFFYYLLCSPVAPALFASRSFTFSPSSPPLFPPLSVLQGVGFSGSESCFALKNSLS